MTKQHRPHQLQTRSLQVSAEVIHAYAELTDDFNPLHMDAEFAAKTAMGRQIAHGTMSLCLVFQCLELNFGGSALAGVDLDVLFIRPVFIGDEIIAGGELSPEQPDLWNIWVRDTEGVDRIVGSCRIPIQDQ